MACDRACGKANRESDKRSGLTREQVMARIASQDYSNIKNNRVEYIINDENKSLTNQLLTLLTKSL